MLQKPYQTLDTTAASSQDEEAVVLSRNAEGAQAREVGQNMTG